VKAFVVLRGGASSAKKTAITLPPCGKRREVAPVCGRSDVVGGEAPERVKRWPCALGSARLLFTARKGAVRLNQPMGDGRGSPLHGRSTAGFVLLAQMWERGAGDHAASGRLLIV
jgi:hypothetical protein